MKLNRIAKGLYAGTHKGFPVTVETFDEEPPKPRPDWIFSYEGPDWRGEVGPYGSDEHYPTKKRAIEALKKILKQRAKFRVVAPE